MSNAKFPYLAAEDVANFPSVKHGLDPEKELSYRQQASAFIQELGQRLQCTQCTMNTAIVYMHRFYFLNSFTKFHRNTIAPACLFLACKVEEQPRKVEHIIKVVYRILYREKQPPEPNSEPFVPLLMPGELRLAVYFEWLLLLDDRRDLEYLQKAEELVVNENILLQTLGFRIIVDHPHPHIVRYCDRDLATTGQGHHIAQVAWFLATNSLHLTTFCLQYPPTVIAALCIYLSCKYISCPLQSKSNQQWWYDIDRGATEELLNKLALEFVTIMDKAPTKYKTIKGSKIGSESLLGHGPSHPIHAVANEDSCSIPCSADATATGEIVKQELHDKVAKTEVVEERVKSEMGKSQRSIATTDDDELSSPPRKQSKLGTAISLKDYKARKMTLEQQVTVTTQAGESPNVEFGLAAKSSPAVTSNAEPVQSNSNVPVSLQGLPPLEPLTLSQANQVPPPSDSAASKDATKVVSRHSLDSNKTDSRTTLSYGEKPPRVDADRHRSTNHLHHHPANKPPSAQGVSFEEGAKPPVEPGVAVHGSSSADRHRHHSHHHHHHHIRPESGEKQQQLDRDSNGSHRQRRSSHRPSELEHSNSNMNGSSKPVLIDSTAVDMSSKISIDGSLMDACQILLATPPSPSSTQHQDLMEIVKN